MERLDVGRRLGVIAERLAQHADGFRQRGVGDERVLPDPIDQVLARHHLAGALEQQLEDADDARRSFPLSAAIGGAMLIGADLIARGITETIALPVGAVMSLIGAPFLMILLRRSLR